MPVQRELRRQILNGVKRSRHNTHHHFHYQLNFCQIQEGQHVVVEEGNVSIGRINMKKEKTMKWTLTDRTDSTSEPRVGAGDGS